MSFMTKFSNGWQVAKISMQVLKAHKELIIFPILSGISLLLVLGSFFTALFAAFGWDMTRVSEISRGSSYLIMFGYYFVNYFIIVFFNMALMHCARLYFEGNEVTVAAGLKFSLTRIGSIVSWGLLAATVGTVLKAIQEKSGWLGKIITGLIGIVWGIATFFVVPVLAYENVGPIDAVKRSSELMKEKWGESLGANFSLGLISFLGVLIMGVLGAFISLFINMGLGIAVFALGTLTIFAIMSSLQSIFISALYNHVYGDLNTHFNQQMLDSMFIVK